MTQINLLNPKANPDRERRRALAKVYELLIRLAEEAENTAVHLTVSSTDATDTIAPEKDVEET